MRRSNGGARLLRLLAVVLGVALIACLSALVYRANQNASAADRDAQFLLTTESDAANLVFSQREAGNLALKANAWLAGNATRRDVQVARALLARRLAVVGENGPNPAATDPQLIAGLADFDAAFANAPAGILPDAQRASWSASLLPVVDNLDFQGKQLVTEYQQKAAARSRAIAQQQADTQRRQTRLVIASILLAAALAATIARLLVLNNRRARRLLADEEAALMTARSALAGAGRASAGQSRVLEAIATGQPLADTLALVADLAVLDRPDTAARVSCGGLVVTAGPVPPEDAESPARPVWQRRIQSSRTPTEASDAPTNQARLEVFAPSDLSDEAKEQAGVCAGLLAIAVERDDAEQRLTFQARHDPLTGLPNRLTLMDELETLLQRRTPDSSLGVLFVDLDRFKDVNDSLGHEAGDQLLVSVVRRLHAAIRADDILFRLAGDEFVVLCPGLKAGQGAAELAQRLLSDLAEPIIIADTPVWVTASIGVAINANTSSAGELLHEADLAMYRAKADGRNRWHLFDSTLAAEATDRLKLSSALKKATENSELRLLYQPILDMTSGEVFGYEALLRWERPGHGLVPPDAFLDMAEENREIVAIGGWVLEEALEQLARWRSEGMSPAVVMSVNVSVQQLLEPGFPTLVLAALEGTDVLATSLVLEVTEHSLAEGEAVASSLSLLRRAGVRVALDDFGTGYSSLTQLERLGVDIVKVDRDFVRSPTPDSPRHEAFLRGVVNMVRALDVTIVVEGVETEAERQELLRAGFSLGQGFLLGTPTDHPLDIAVSGGQRPLA